MARRKKKEKNIRKLTKTGGGRTTVVSIPADYIRRLGWRERQNVRVTLKGGALIVRDAKTKRRV